MLSPCRGPGGCWAGPARGCCPPSSYSFHPSMRCTFLLLTYTWESGRRGGALHFFTCRAPVYILCRERACGPCTPGTCGQAWGSRREPEDRPGPAHSSSGPELAAGSWGKIFLQVPAGPRSGWGLVAAAGASAEAWGPEGHPANPRGDPTPLAPAPTTTRTPLPSGCSWCLRLGVSEQWGRVPRAHPQQPGSPAGRRGGQRLVPGLPTQGLHGPHGRESFLQPGVREGIFADSWNFWRGWSDAALIPPEVTNFCGPAALSGATGCCSNRPRTSVAGRRGLRLPSWGGRGAGPAGLSAPGAHGARGSAPQASVQVNNILQSQSS